MPVAAVSSSGCPSGYMVYLWSAVDSSTRNSVSSRGSAGASALAWVVGTRRWATGVDDSKKGAFSPSESDRLPLGHVTTG